MSKEVHEQDHSDKFASSLDHDNCARILEEFSHDDDAFESLKNGMRLDLNDQELLNHLRKTTSISTTISENNTIDDTWESFKGDFGRN